MVAPIRSQPEEAAALLYLTRDDLLLFWKTLYVGGDKPRVFVSEIIPRQVRASSLLLSSSFGYKLMDMTERESLALTHWVVLTRLVDETGNRWLRAISTLTTTLLNRLFMRLCSNGSWAIMRFRSNYVLRSLSVLGEAGR